MDSGISREEYRWKNAVDDLPVKEVDGVKVFVHLVRPTPAEQMKYDEWWRSVLARRLDTEGAKPGEITVS